jgi:hypothetical protein
MKLNVLQNNQDGGALFLRERADHTYDGLERLAIRTTPQATCQLIRTAPIWRGKIKNA